jgi:SAM-dependent methyltransferase
MLKPARRRVKVNSPKTWYDLPAGGTLKVTIENSLTEISQQLFGYYTVAIGDLSCELSVPNIPTKYKILQSPSLQANASVVGDNTQLPFQENSVDVAVLAHQLEFASDPHSILREVDRIVRPDGYMVLSGFNPLSLTGICRFLPIERTELLRQARFFTLFRVKDWLSLLGFEVVFEKKLLFSDLIFYSPQINESPVQMLSQSAFSMFNSTYVMVAKKQTLPMSMIKPKRRASRKLGAISQAC